MRNALPGYSVPTLLIVSAMVLGAGFAAYTSFRSQVLGTSSNRQNTVSLDSDIAFAFSLISPQSSWTLDQYLCKTLEGCSSSKRSGDWWASLSGGATSDTGEEVFLEKSEKWNGYSYLKLVPTSSATLTFNQNSLKNGAKMQEYPEGFYILRINDQ